jgi:hypothetical protein
VTLARPRKEIDPSKVVKLGRLGLTVAEIGDILGVSARTLFRRYGGTLRRARACARMSLRRAMYIRAIRCKSDKMLIWLGKVELGQSVSAGGDTLDAVLADLLGSESSSESG